MAQKTYGQPRYTIKCCKRYNLLVDGDPQVTSSEEAYVHRYTRTTI